MLFPGWVVSNILNILRSVEMSGATHTVTQYQILEDLDLSIGAKRTSNLVLRMLYLRHVHNGKWWKEWGFQINTDTVSSVATGH